MALPEEFLKRMKSMLGSDYERFDAALNMPLFRSVRFNKIKCQNLNLKENLKFLGSKTPFCDDAYYIPSDVKGVGNHPLHHAGAFYMQEPSAAFVVEAIGIEKGDIVLDMCAAPGGKSTQAASKLGGTGLLVANEFVSSRVKPLQSNIERMGITNSVILSLRPDIIADKLPEMFDKVIVDAPCSGEGMFRKESAAVENWSVENVSACADRQLKILQSAAKAVKRGGKMVYSTCTYSPEENECVVAQFLKTHPDFRLVNTVNEFGEPAFEQFAPDTENIKYARRIFNFNGGEGHFAAVMQREGEKSEGTAFTLEPEIFDKKSDEIRIFYEFFTENFRGEPPENIIVNNGFVYIIAADIEKYGIKPVQNGILAGIVKGKRFVPEHALFNNVRFIPENIINLPCDDKNILKFLHGEEIGCDASLKGYTQVRCSMVPLGFGKASGGVLKNHYPKGLRTL